MFCTKLINGRITRAKDHLMGKKCNVQVCIKCSYQITSKKIMLKLEKKTRDLTMFYSSVL